MRSSPKRDGVRRSGIAASECALALPILFLITIGTIETCTTIFLKESVTIAAYEGARVAIQRTTTTTDVENRITAILAERGVDLDALEGRSAISITPDPQTADMLVPITVTVLAPCNGNTVFPVMNWLSWFGTGEVQAQVVMRKEFKLQS